MPLRLLGATVARLTPDQKVACSNHVGVISFLFYNLTKWIILGDSVIKSLLRQMNGVYAPIFFETTSLPESICNDFSARMHRFLGSCSRTLLFVTVMLVTT